MEDGNPQSATAGGRVHAPSRGLWRLVPRVGAALFVAALALALIVVGKPQQPRLPTIAAQNVSLDAVASTPTTTCGLLTQLLGGCKTTTTTTNPATGGATQPTTVPTSPSPSTAPSSPRASGGASTTTSTIMRIPPTPISPPAPIVNPPGGPKDGCSGSAPPVAVPSGKWSCTFDDEFNGTTLDTTKWLPQLTANSAYTTGSKTARPCYVNTPQTISESGGTLNLSMVRLAKPAYCVALNFFGASTPYQAGMVSTDKLFSQQYGFFEIRAETPPTNAKGLQETFWLYPLDQNLYGKWPDSGEIDFAEFYSYLSEKDFPVLHYPGAAKDPHSNAVPNGCDPGGASTSSQFNTYAVLWTPSALTTYFNGVPCFTDTYGPYVTHPDTPPEPFNQPFFLNLTSALGSGANVANPKTPMPATTRIDWVRVWQYG